MRIFTLAIVSAIIVSVIGNVNVATEVDGTTTVVSGVETATAVPVAPTETVVDFIKKKNISGLRSYLDAKGNPNLFAGQSLLILCAVSRFAEGIDVLAAAGANPDVLESDGWSPILFSTVFGDIDSINALMAHKANPFIVAKNVKKNAYDLAIQTNNQPVIF